MDALIEDVGRITIHKTRSLTLTIDTLVPPVVCQKQIMMLIKIGLVSQHHSQCFNVYMRTAQ